MQTVHSKHHRPSSIAFTSGNLPDAIVASNYMRGDECGLALYLLSPRAFSLFPEAPTDGPAKGLLWFSETARGSLCELEERHGLHFHGIAG